MRRVRYYEYGGPEVLTVEQTDVPRPGPGQILIRTEAVAVNFVDTRYRRGPSSGAIFRRPLPGTLTGDVVGTIEAAGADVTTLRPGQRVAALAAEDAYAEFVLADAAWAVTVPDDLDAGTASVLPMAAPVALRALRSAPLAAGETVLVHSAAGGIGHLIVQLAKVLDAGRVIGMAGSEAKLRFARTCGADTAIGYTEPDWADQVHAAAPGGVDVVTEAVGGDTLLRSFDLLSPYGRMVSYGAASAELVSVPITTLFRLRSVVGFTITAFRMARPDQARAEMTELAALATAGRLRAAVHTTLPLAEAAEAHRILEQREQMGRILLVP